MRRLYEWWEMNKPPDYNGPGVMGLAATKVGGPTSLRPVAFYTSLVHRRLDNRVVHKGLTGSELGIKGARLDYFVIEWVDASPTTRSLG
jgi:hypothetical protein